LTSLFADADIMSGKMFSLGHIISFVLLVATVGGAVYFRSLLTHIRTAVTVLLAGVALLATWGGSRAYQSMQFDANVRDYVVAAYKTDDKEKAQKYIKAALTYLKDTGANRGHSAVFAGGQTDDLAEYYSDLSKVLDEMERPADTKVVSLSEGDPDNNKTVNVKVKPYKERLVELGFITTKGDDYASADLRHPTGMALAPNNFMYFMWGLVGSFLSVGGGAWTTASVIKRVRDKGQIACQSCNGTGCRAVPQQPVRSV